MSDAPPRDILRCLIREPADTYHARRRERLTSHRLADFRSCPLLFRRREQGLIAERRRRAFQIGRVAASLRGRMTVQAKFSQMAQENQPDDTP